MAGQERKDDTVAAARAGDAGAFAALFDRSLPRLIAFIRARAGGVVAARESATDLAQSVCREALEDLDGFEYRNEREFRNWLLKRATRKIFNRQRWLQRERRDARRELQASSDSEAERIAAAYADLVTPSEGLRAREEVARIEAALDRLPAAQRDAVSLTKIAELTYAEAAAHLGRTESAVRGLVMRGLARMAELLETSEGGPAS